MAPVVVPTGSSRRQQQKMDGVLSYLEQPANGVSNDGWQHLSSDMIITIHILPLDFTGVMRKMVMACEHFHRAVIGDLPIEDESSEEDDDTKSDGESK